MFICYFRNKYDIKKKQIVLIFNCLRLDLNLSLPYFFIKINHKNTSNFL